MKKILNSVDTLVTEMCQGMVSTHPDLITFNSKYKIIERKHLNKDKVSLITGGGSGHEPCHAGYVGKGMLDAVACGEIFSSPSVSQVYNAILDTKSNKGTLLIIKNYSGDCMNFKAAAEMAAKMMASGLSGFISTMMWRCKTAPIPSAGAVSPARFSFTRSPACRRKRRQFGCGQGRGREGDRQCALDWFCL